MNTRSALGAAAGLTLALTGGATAIGLGLTQTASSSSEPASIVTEYVDQFGNPVAAPAAVSADGMPQIVLMQPDGTIVTTEATPAMAAAEPAPQGMEIDYAAGENQTEHEHDDYEDDDRYEEAEHDDDHEEYEDD
jgi:hypothetical protein